MVWSSRGLSFSFKNGQLYCEGVPISAIAAQAGTPFYVYSLSEIERRYEAFTDAFPGALICYYKANANLAILRLLARAGAGADVVSAGELHRALMVGTSPQKIVFNGNGKTDEEITYALQSEVLAINIDCREELLQVAKLAQATGRSASIALRVNPDIDPGTHPHIATGLKRSKFGVPIGEALQLYREAAGMSSLAIVGIHCHIGSQITSLEPLIESARAMRALALHLQEASIPLHHINLGGGLGISYYKGENALGPQHWADAVLPIVGDLGYHLLLEPGRAIVGPAGALVCRVLHTKRTVEKNLVVLEAGMNALLRPALYDAYHRVQPVHEAPPAITADVVGPICEQADVLAKERQLPLLARGDLVAVMDTGAYGFALASHYNQQPLPAEVVVRGEKFRVTRKWESLADLTAGEEMSEDLL